MKEVFFLFLVAIASMICTIYRTSSALIQRLDVNGLLL